MTRTGFAASRTAEGTKVAPPDNPGNELPVTGGNVDFDGIESEIWARCSLSFESEDLIPVDATSVLAPYGQELQVWREGVSLGIFRIQDVNVVEAGDGVAISVNGLDRASSITDEPFDAPGFIAPDSDYLTVIQEKVLEANGAVDFEFPSVVYDTPRLIFQEGDDRWEFVRNMAFAVGYHLRFNRDGILVMEQIPTASLIADFDVVEGENGVLLRADKTWDRSEASNRWIVTGESTEEIVVRGEAIDSDPNSPTFYGPPFGKVTKFASYEHITTADQAADAALGLLNLNRGIAKNINFGSIVNPDLEPGMSIRISRERLGLDEIHVLDTLTIPLSVEEPMTGTTRQAVGVS